MSDPATPLNGAHYAGYVTIAEAAPRGMITLRGDLGDKGFAKVVKAVTGLALPGQREFAAKGDFAVAWMSPDELLVLCTYDRANAVVADLTAQLGDLHSLAVNVSDARALIEITGDDAREVLAKLAPVDLSPGAFGPGQIRRSRLAQVPAAFWMTDTGFQLVCFRSVADYVFEALSTVAQPGSRVGALV
ncbi:sarcosine oxidase subunit gamma [Actibacterium sp. XHP0104]|uniref:sarcosine oxidase subunit gamma n=1 Tax=Actibacterium sp. XHP0104 TaxID=2984335 RepID=UPI0021E7D8CD|nr:sarcosine oxidase subunit gamma family protein [Actibacterium sp. XHP0104]MCV2881529.1 sarcosine oxidase subunit gamma [Actibacterium sp. XHP0104]